MQQLHVFTLFPNILAPYFSTSILGRAATKGLVNFQLHNIREYAPDKNRTTDDRPYGGGAGMVMLAEPIVQAVTAITRQSQAPTRKRKVLIMSAKGTPFTQARAYRWAKHYDELCIISGRYEGIDERVKKILRAEEVSIGPYVMTDGDVAAMVIASAVTRLVPGVIRMESLAEESHWRSLLRQEVDADPMLEYPHYTRPEVLEWQGKKYRVPKVLLSGDHKKIEQWRKSKRQ